LPSVIEAKTAARAFPAGGHVVESAIGVGLVVGEVAGLAVLGPLQPVSKMSARIAIRFMFLKTEEAPKPLRRRLHDLSAGRVVLDRSAEGDFRQETARWPGMALRSPTIRSR
jgi:hypothetical protein